MGAMHEKMLGLATEIERGYGKMMPLEKVAGYLGLDVPTVETLVKSGEIGSLEIAGTYMVKPVQLAKFELDVMDMPVMGVPLAEGEREVSIMKVSNGSIYKTNSSKNPLEMCFFITFDDGKKERVKVRGASEGELEQKKQEKAMEELGKYRAEKKGAMDMGQPTGMPVHKKATFREVSDMWLREFKAENEAKGNGYSNMKSAEYSLKLINGVIGDMDIRGIDKTVAQEMVNAISVKKNGEYASKSLVGKATQKFKRVMEYALEEGYIDRQIGGFYLSKNLTEPDKDARFIEMDTLRKLLDCIKENPFYNTLVNLMLSSGLRQEEALALTIDDLRERDGMYQIHIDKAVVEVASNKFEVTGRLKHGEEARYVSITEDVYVMLGKYYTDGINNIVMNKKRVENGTEKYIFVNQNGRIHNKRTLYHSMVKYLENRMGEGEKVRLHMLRHTFASLMKNEIPLEEVSAILGHRDTSITMRFYASQTEEGHRRAGAGVEAMMKKIKE